MSKLSIKAGVKFEKDSVALGRMLAALLTLDYKGEIVITAGSDGTHMVGSRHYVGEAIDIRSSNLADPGAFVLELTKSLGPKFSVLTEVDHIHVQVRKGGKYP